MESEHSRKTRAARRAMLLSVYLPTALLSLAEGILLPTLPAYALTFDVSFAVASLVLAAAGIGTLVADVPAGMLLGRLGLKPTMLLGAAMVIFGTFMVGLAGSIELIVVFRLISGVGTALWGLSRHVTPRVGSNRRLGTVGARVSCGGITVEPGDWIVGDDDGVVVVAQADAERLVDAGLAIEDKERAIAARIDAGERIADILNFREAIG